MAARTDAKTILRLLLVLSISSLTGWIVGLGGASLSAVIVSIWSGDDSFVRALTWMTLGTWGICGLLVGFVCGLVGWAIWLRRFVLGDLFLVAPTLVVWTFIGAAMGSVLLFPLTLISAPWGFFVACARCEQAIRVEVSIR
jgi:hypothetical protein